MNTQRTLEERAISYRLDDYDYDLPPELIAQMPADRRDESRLMVLDRRSRTWEHRVFSEIVHLLRPGDVLVLNNTRVVRARLTARKPSGGKVELLILNPFEGRESQKGKEYGCITRSSKPLKPGMILTLENASEDIQIEIAEVPEPGKAHIRLRTDLPLLSVLERFGSVPLPPYIRRNEANRKKLLSLDLSRYQTVYALKPGAVAAPTAGFHFTENLLEELRNKGIFLAYLTLHVGYGTFAPVRSEDIRHHVMHSEWCEIDDSCVNTIEEARRSGGRVIAVGTTCVRALEWVMTNLGKLQPHAGWCDHYIYPGYRFKIVDAMVTNFHLPRSTLLLLVAAFAGKDFILAAYREAVRERYRFFSYGDAMLIT
ncbi:tRNA preQ1(34) S-adenosylmethionine ribosyltransferase-isomerase QueA [Thermodesulforhabdus norvegica]|uniref:S-adenosylmethionine:tRNA ribosyltransferase-isomerase n=1 Tax=Thermodesulforhabdus norvegica TaxID=39841 RepID=A0A1I4SAZ1_9BACT|nr:tRNA preQ1(34) S-adenosylmethionine ribosyltransferase-isomerase QueA [Thermodesulforhabdus norvegica]SFM61658.1 S-adenosylmethionine--tRNA ribosyltransferase-isomerase [Thermodesulforhabdus norvegica]